MKRQSSVVIQSPLILFVVLLLLYMAVSFWTNAGTNLIYDTFHHGKEPSWKWQATYATIFTGVIYYILRHIQYPIVALQHGQIRGIFA
jgi:uncharacterized membrane protein